MHQLQQAQLQVESLLLLVAELAVGAQQDLQEAGQVFLAEFFRHAGDARALVGRDLQQRRIGAANFGDHGIPQEADQLPREVRRVLSFGNQFIEQPQHAFAGVLGHGVEDLFQRLRRDGAHQPAHHLRRERGAAAGDGLIHDGERVAHGAVADLGQHGQRAVVRLDASCPAIARNCPTMSSKRTA